MILSQLLVNSVYAVLKGNVEVEISEIVSDSRKVTKGCVFVCISGNHFDGHSTICQVLADGACAIIVERLSREVEELLTDDDRECTVILVE
ncbi:MAG: Mur ligase domain-containing protein, partial [Lachnospiraceae bacterium]